VPYNILSFVTVRPIALDQITRMHCFQCK